MIIRIIIVIVIILTILCLTRLSIVEKFNEHRNNIISNIISKENLKIDLIVAHYKEDLSWLDNIPENYNLYIYSKSNDKPTLKRSFYHKFLPNVGRCDHTYLYHIIENYNNMSDQMIFCTGSTNALPHKWYVFNKITDNIGRYHFYTTKLFRAHEKYKKFRILKYCASHKANLTDSSCSIIKSKYGNLGDYENKLIGKGTIKYITFYN